MASTDALPIEIATNIGTLHMTNQGQLRPNYSFSVVLAAITHTAMNKRRVGRQTCPLDFLSFHT